jgi:N-methylhydantoinase A
VLLGVDVGGTFTDAALHDAGSLWTAKVPTTPADHAEGVLRAVDRVLEAARTQAADVTTFAHGTTVGTNALLEERGARTALVATKGFTDLLDVGRQNRPHLYRLCQPKPSPLVGEADRFALGERIGAGGEVIAEPSEDDLEELAGWLADSGCSAVAVCLLFSYAEPAHERRVTELLRDRFPQLHVSASHEVLPKFREYERCSTTVIDAYLSPLLAEYLSRLGDRARDRGLPEPVVMLSSGGVLGAGEAARSGARTVLSGPAGGAVGAGLTARASGDGDAVGLDMGGTSCDVCVVEGGAVRRTDARQIAGRPLQLPMVDVHTVGAGGGSIAWLDSGGALRVGPRSAGAVPGPACYGLGGREPTVTDANLLLGYLGGDSSLGADLEIDAGLAERAVAELARGAGIDTVEAAAGIVRVANQEMLRALRVVTVERGIDPRGFALMPFGGAGPMHAAALAEELGMDRVLCPRASGVLSALGLLASEQRRDTARTVLLSGEEVTGDRLADEVASLVDAIGEGLREATPEIAYEMRYLGQAFELAVPGPVRADPAALASAFADEHERRYGFRDPEAEVEIVSIRVGMATPRDPLSLPPAPEGELRSSSRRARFGHDWAETDVHRGDPPAGFSAEGPCIFELPEATLVLPPGWSAAVDEHGTIKARRA